MAALQLQFDISSSDMESLWQAGTTLVDIACIATFSSIRSLLWGLQ